MVELVKSGRTPNELAREYEPSAGSIRNWVAQHERDGGQRSDGLSTDELVELRRLRRENKQLRTERDILKRGGLVRTGERRDPREGFEFVKANQAAWPVRTMCRVLGLSASGLLRMGASRSVGTSATGFFHEAWPRYGSILG